MAFDPFSSGAATEVAEKPAAPKAFDPFALGGAAAETPGSGDESPFVGDWRTMFGGLDKLRQHMDPTQKAVADQLASVSENPKESLAGAILDPYLKTQMPGVSLSAISKNRQAVYDTYAKQEFGFSGKNISATTLYGMVGKRVTETQEAEEAEFGTIKPWTWKAALGSDVYAFKKNFQGFISSIDKPLVELPEAPKDLPNIPSLLQWNPALLAGIYNAERKQLSGLTSPMNIALAGAASGLSLAGETYPAAKAALTTMTGIFTGLMGKQTYEAGGKFLDTLKDPKATFEQKTEAGADMVTNGAMALVGALGIALELFPKEQLPPILDELKGKNPQQGAEILRREGEETDIPGHKQALDEAAKELERISGEDWSMRGGIFSGEKGPQIPEPTETPGQPPISAEQRAAAMGREGVPQAATKPEVTPEATPVSPEPQKPVESPAGDVTGVKNAAIDAEFDKLDLEAAKHGEKTTDKAEMAKAKAAFQENPDVGKNLVDDLMDKPRTIKTEEVAILQREAVRLKLVRKAAEEALIKAGEANDHEAVVKAEADVARARDEFARLGEAATVSGTKQAQAFRMRQVMLKEDYSIAALDRRTRAAQRGKAITPEQEAENRLLSKQLEEAQAKVDEYERQQREAKAAPVTRAPKRPPLTKRVAEFTSKQADAARSRLKAKYASGRVSSGIDPTDIADHAIIGADYIAKGVDKFAEWSTAMVNEFGDHIRPYLQEIFKQSIEARDQARRLEAYKARMPAQIEKAGKKLASGDFTKRARKAMQMDPEATRLRADFERVKRKIQLKEQELELKNRTVAGKIKDLSLAVNRAGVLSRVGIILKLSAIIAERAVMTPIRQGIGYAVGKVAPGLARQGRLEAVPTFGGYVRSEAKALTAIFTKGLPGAWKLLRMKDTDLQAVLEKEHLPPGALSYPSHIHAALHYPIQVSDYVRRLQLINEQDLRAGTKDMAEPMNQLANMQEAWEYSKRSIFLQNNKLVNGYKALLKTWSSPDKASGGKPNPVARMLAYGLQMENPVVKVPVNLAEEVGEHVFGLMDPPVRMLFKGIGGFKGLNYGEADMVLRHIKNGLLGSALVLMGFFKYKEVGGFYEEGEKRKKKDVQPGEVRVGNVTVPSVLLKDTSMEALMSGSTLHRTLDSTYRLNDPKKKGIPAALLAVGVGIADENPFIRNSSILGKIMDPRSRENAVAADIANHLIPGFVQEAAAEQDKQTPYNPFERPQGRVITAPDFGGAFKQNIMKELPYLREELKKRRDPASYRNAPQPGHYQ